jgi:hypothetical protein
MLNAADFGLLELFEQLHEPAAALDGGAVASGLSG